MFLCLPCFLAFCALVPLCLCPSLPIAGAALCAYLRCRWDSLCFKLFPSSTQAPSEGYRCIFLHFSTSTLPCWPPTKGHSCLIYRKMPDMFPREKKYSCQLWARAGSGGLAEACSGKWWKRLDLSLVAPQDVPLDPSPTSLLYWAYPRLPMAGCWHSSLLPSPLTACALALSHCQEAKLSGLSRMRTNGSKEQLLGQGWWAFWVNSNN